MTTIPVPTFGTGGPSIEGFVTAENTGQPIVNLDITFQLQRTMAEIYAQTDEQGHFEVLLDDFQGGWQPGDIVWIIPGQIDGYYVCHPYLEISSVMAPDYQFHIDLSATPISEDSNIIDMGSMWLKNHDQNSSYIYKTLIDGQEKLIDKKFKSVSIVCSCCYQDDGTNDLSPGQSLDVYYVYTLESRVNGTVQWGYHNDVTSGYYTVYYGRSTQSNPPNINFEITKQENFNRRWDFHFNIYSRNLYDSNEVFVNKSAYLYNIKFRFIE